MKSFASSNCCFLSHIRLIIQGLCIYLKPQYSLDRNRDQPKYDPLAVSYHDWDNGQSHFAIVKAGPL